MDTLIIQEPRQSAYDLIFSVAGIPVRVSPWFWLIAAAIRRQPNVPLTVLWVGVVFTAVLIHEYGHALTARKFGAPRPRIVLAGTGGLTFSLPADSWSRRVLVDLAGVGAGFATCVLLIVLRRSILRHDLPFRAMKYLDFFAANLIYVNTFWGCLNLLPILPLDGGRVTREMTRRFAPGKGDRLAWKVSVAAAALAVFACVRYGQSLGAILFGYLAWLNVQRLMSAQGGRPPADFPPRKEWEKEEDWWRKDDG